MANDFELNWEHFNANINDTNIDDKPPWLTDEEWEQTNNKNINSSFILISNSKKIYINVPFKDKDLAKQQGAMWDPNKKSWYFIGEHNRHRFNKWLNSNTPTLKYNDLSAEQQHFIDIVKTGKNILVDACIGSGKTTAIQVLCNELPKNKHILYLTYNTLLKIDAKSKIQNSNVWVTNYHGFAYTTLQQLNINVGVNDLIQEFNKHKPPIKHYDILLIDEYQDIEEETSLLLEHIKNSNPGLQIIAVGDMDQKIYDKTALDVRYFISSFLDVYDTMRFTQCFRLNKEISSKLGRIWGKSIKGVNNNCKISTMKFNEVVNFLSRQNPCDVLCLGSRNGDMPRVLNLLEKTQPHIYNKNTVYASIHQEDKNLTPNVNYGIFTTFDSCKGLERKICVVFDFTEQYWYVRQSKPLTNTTILRNIFCVAASRGKEHIIFVLPRNKKNGKASKSTLLSEQTLINATGTSNLQKKYFCSSMFDFKYAEDINECVQELNITKINNAEKTIEIDRHDGLIDLSPCIGIFQEANYFTKYNIQKTIAMQNEQYKDRKPVVISKSLQQTILDLTAQETLLNRYSNQVTLPFITAEQSQAINNRLNTIFNPNVQVQGYCKIKIHCKKHILEINGLYDVFYNNTIYELKFVNSVSNTHFLQLAMYLIAQKQQEGILWNIYNNERYTVSIKDINKFLAKIVRCISKRHDIYKGFYDTINKNDITH